jgi:O-antigen/teichoic acid export membrane protein
MVPVSGGEAATSPRSSFLRIVSGAGLLTSARVAGDLASAVLFIVISRAFGVEGTGLYAYAFAVAQIAHLIVDFGMMDYGMREYASAEGADRRRILANALGIQCALLAAVAAGIWLYLIVTGASAEAATLVWLLTAYLVLFHFALMLFIPPITAQRMGGPALAELCFRVGGTCVAVALVAWAGTGLASSLAVLPIAAFLMVVVATVIARRFNGPIGLGLDRARAPAMLRASTTFAGSSLIAGLLAKVGLILLTFFEGTAAAGIFATGLKLLDLGMAPLLFLGIAVYPRLAGSFGKDQDDLAYIAEQFVRLSLVLGSLVLWGMVFVVPPILPLLLGPDFAAAGPAVQLTGVLALFTALDLAAARLLWSLRLQGRRLRIQAIGVVANVTLNLVLIPTAGVMGAIAAAILTLGLMLALALRPIIGQLPPGCCSGIGRSCLLPAVAVAVTGLAVVMLQLSPWLAAPATLVAFLLASFVSGLVGIAQLRSFAR